LLLAACLLLLLLPAPVERAQRWLGQLLLA
jgi:hypothetical protein